MSEVPRFAASTVPGGTRVDGLPAPLLIRQLYLGCLSQASYLVGDSSTGRAIVVDPRRDVGEILAAAAEDGLTVELVVETHFHADFLSGHLEVAAATGAEIGVGAAATTEFGSRPLHDGDLIDLGSVQVEIWSTPGHTPESISLVVRAAPGADPAAVLTGDTLFIGDVGRPDLLVASDVPAEVLGAQLYDSVHRIAALPATTLVLPAHGAGSACGKSLSSETISTIGEQRASNYALAPMDRDTFVRIVTDGQPAAPGYFGYDASLNRKDRALLDDGPLAELDLVGLDAARLAGATVIDVRATNDFATGHITGTIGIALDGRFAEQAGSVVDVDAPIVLLGDAETVAEARLRLARIGFDRVTGASTRIGALVAEHPERAGHLRRITTAEYRARRDDTRPPVVLDVRNPGEVADRPVEGARNIPLARLRAELGALDRAAPTVVMCAGGARSAIASSVLRAAGFTDVSDVLGGANALGLSAPGAPSRS